MRGFQAKPLGIESRSPLSLGTTPDGLTKSLIAAVEHSLDGIALADLDGNLLISNDIYKGVEVIDGKVTLNDLPGIGIRKLNT